MPDEQFRTQMTALSGYARGALAMMVSLSETLSEVGKAQLYSALRQSEAAHVQLLATCIDTLSGCVASLETSVQKVAPEPRSSQVDTPTATDARDVLDRLIARFMRCRQPVVCAKSAKDRDACTAWFATLDAASSSLNAFSGGSIATIISTLSQLSAPEDSDARQIHDAVRQWESMSLSSAAYVALGETSDMHATVFQTQDGMRIDVPQPQTWISYRIEMPPGWTPTGWLLSKGILSGRSMSLFNHDHFITEKRLRTGGGPSSIGTTVEDVHTWTVDLVPGSRLDIWARDLAGFVHEFSVTSNLSTSITPAPPASTPT